jgi:hypothetical protein
MDGGGSGRLQLRPGGATRVAAATVMPDTTSLGSWGAGWQGVTPSDALQAELAAETAAPHPLAALRPKAVGRCRSCDDVVAIPTAGLAFPEVLVIHLTWQGHPEQRDGEHWPCYERLAPGEFIARFIRGAEHL